MQTFQLTKPISRRHRFSASLDIFFYSDMKSSLIDDAG